MQLQEISDKYYYPGAKTGISSYDVEMDDEGAGMKKDWKYKVAKATGGNQSFDKRILKLKSSWDEVEGILNSSVKKKKKK